MQQQEMKLVIASRLLSGIISQDRNRKLPDRSEDIDHSLELAEELIRRNNGHSLPTCELTLQPNLHRRTREKVIQRDQPPLNEILQARRSAPAQQAPVPPHPRNTLH